MTKLPSSWNTDLEAAVAGLKAIGPNQLLKRVNIDREGDDVVTEDDLAALLKDHNQQNNAAVRHLCLALAEWDFAEEPAWDVNHESGPTTPRTTERRSRTYDALKLPAEARKRLDEIAPIATQHVTVISTRWNPWYTEERRNRSAFYWPNYKQLLIDTGGWRSEAVAALDHATTKVVERLADPSGGQAYQSKGLVVGYVQSGKTANFTGVISKAIDAGYRLVIVLTGTIELLRSQTQRRLDKELVGVENLTRGIVEGDEFDYDDDDEWRLGKFVSHGAHFWQQGYPGIERMTLLHDDYKRLKQGLSRMQFHLRDRSKPFYHEDNLLPSDARLLVVKKNSTVLKKLAKDLKPLKGKLDEIPALVIDDESDLASVNTKNPKRTAERTAVNKAISELLGYLKRAQYVGYTATPFANVFIDPDDAADLFPKNFVLCLDRPPDYMGVRDFHDFDWSSEDDKSDPSISNEHAYVRAISADPDDEPGRVQEMTEALDAFVLAGALKVFREQHGHARFRHHTMLVRESVQTGEHLRQATLVRNVWAKASYGSPAALDRLRDLWQRDFEPVCAARSAGAPMPCTFEELTEPIGEACKRIRDVGDPVLVVNSDTDVQKNQQALDFDRNDVWRILVGGAKLSRGFTVEGLTISFYGRPSLQGDTLMQAGRWFGFRRGYRDLVRLYIRRDKPDIRRRVDLYEAFEGLMRDEEAFRARLMQYEGFDKDGRPIMEPWQVPPLVSQHLPYLRPTARNKMFNAVIETAGDAGQLRDFYGHPERSEVIAKAANYDLSLSMLRTASERSLFSASLAPGVPSTSFEARIGVIGANEIMRILEGFQWHPRYEAETFAPIRRFYRQLVDSKRLRDMVVLWPILTKSARELSLPNFGKGQVVTRNRRQEPRIDFVGSDSKHRDAVETIAGAGTGDDVVARQLRDPMGTRGAALIYVAADPSNMINQITNVSDLPEEPSSEDLVVLLSLVAPATATDHGRSVITWTVRRSDLTGSPIVDADKGNSVNMSQ